MSKHVESHYGLGGLGDRILGALEQAGADLDALTLEDLAPVDAFHVRGREASKELAAIIESGGPVESALDVGCGIGGSCRFLARRFDCRVTGIDLTREYCDVATFLSERLDFGEQTTFRQASALELPFPDDTFDLVWTEHVQMNIEDKFRFYGEIARVLKPGGRFAFHDIFTGPEQPIHFPVPWADNPGISFLVDPTELRDVLAAAGLRETHWEDKTRVSTEFFTAALRRIQQGGPPPVGIHLLMGDSAPVKLGNMTRNLEEGRISILLGMLEKPDR